MLGFVAAYFQFKVPPVLPVMFDLYGYETFVAGGFMSSFAVAGMLISVRIGQGIRQDGAKRYLFAAFALMLTGTAIGLIWPDSGSIMLVLANHRRFRRRSSGGLYARLCQYERWPEASADHNCRPGHLDSGRPSWLPIL